MYRLAVKAEEDILEIYIDGARKFGTAQADAYHHGLERVFEFLSATPQAAREREEIDPPVRIHPFKAHIVVYVTDANGDVLILRVRHGREDWIEAPA